MKVQMLMQNEANIFQETQMESKILQCRKRVTVWVKIIQTAAGTSDETQINRD
jgi:hypothetical protein